MRSGIIYVTQKIKRLPIALEKAEEFAKEMKMDQRQTLRLQLLTEETIGMLRELAGEYRAELWFEGEDKTCELHLELETPMDADKKDDLLSVSTTGKNESVRGFSGRVRNILENFMLGMHESTSAMENPSWSLKEYRNQVKETSEVEEWDELEHSIVANIAEDILVGVVKNRVSMVMRMKLG